jgi:hypothetical protein
MEAIGSLLLISPRYINLDATQESQLQSNSVDGFGTYAGGHTKAIVFRPTKNYTLKGVVLKMYRTGDAESNDVAVDLYSTQNSPYYGWPQTLLQSGSVISKATMTTDTNGAEYTSVFDYALTAGTLYTIVVNGNCNYNSGYMQVGILYQNTDVYPNGWFWWYFENYPQSWFTIGDAWFKILSDPLGIPSGQAFGTTVLTVGWVLQPSGIATAQAFGTASVIKLLQFLQPSGIASAQAFGTALVKKMLQILSLTAGISTAEAFGVPRTRLYLLPSGIISQEIFGSLKLNFKVYPSGIVTQVTFGNARFIMFVRPSGIATAQAFGSPNLLVRRFLYPLSILTGELFGILIIEVAIMLPPVRFGRPKRLLNAIRNLPSDREDGIRRMP